MVTELPYNNEREFDMLTGTINVRGIISMDLNKRFTAVRSRQKVFKRFRRWTGKKLTAIRPVWPGRQRSSSDVEVISKLLIRRLLNFVFRTMRIV